MDDQVRVLVIDDDREIVRGITFRLKAYGYGVLAAHGGEAGFDLAKTHRPDAIILDIRMPDINGLAVLAKLKADDTTRTIPVIMCSASLVDQKEALDLGASFFVQKPFDSAALLSAVQAVLPFFRPALCCGA